MMKGKKDRLTARYTIQIAADRSEKVTFRLSLALLFAISVIFFYRFGNGIFFYQENHALFIYSFEYLQKFINKPGGLLVYSGNFLTQIYHNVLYGSMLISGLVIMSCILLRKILRQLDVNTSFSLLLCLLPSCFLLALHAQYDVFLHGILGFMLVLIWFLVSILPENKRYRIALQFLFIPLYFWIGSFALVYLGMYIIYCFNYEKGMLRYFLASLQVVIAGITFLLFKEFIFLQPTDKMLGYPLSLFDASRESLILSGLSAVFVFFPFFTASTGYLQLKKQLNYLFPWITLVAVFPVTLFLLTRLHDPAFENLMQLERAVQNRQWDSVIRQYEKQGTNNVFEQYYFNLALSEQGQLCESMFSVQQHFGPMALALPSEIEYAGKAMYYYYAIGLVSEARHMAFEIMVLDGYLPENLKMLIKTELINGNYQIADRYLQVLKKTLHYRKWAGKYAAMVQDPALIMADPELGEKIRMLPKADFFIGSNEMQNLEMILKDDPGNRRVFEYKIARMLLEKDFAAAVNEVRKMKGMGYLFLPRHIEEAVLAYIYFKKEVPDLGGLLVRPETEKRFIRYIDDLKVNNGDKKLIDKNMNVAGKASFWYYLQFTTISTGFLESHPGDNTIYGS